MRPAENREILRSACMPNNRALDKLNNMTDRLYELSKMKDKVPKIGLKKWMDDLDKNRAANQKLIQDRLACNYLQKILRDNIRKTWLRLVVADINEYSSGASEAVSTSSTLSRVSGKTKIEEAFI